MRHACLLILCLSIPSTALAQEAAQTGAMATEPDADAGVAVDEDIRDLEAVVVSGVQPGPGLWKVRRGEHTLHILGTVSPLPKDMAWRSAEVTTVLDEAGAVLTAPGIVFGEDIGVLRGLTLLPSALRASRNPDGQTLQDVLPANDYARWQVLKARYLGRDRGIERKRPMLAAFELYQKAVERSGLSGGGVVWPVVEAGLKRRKLKPTPTTLSLKVDDPRAALAEYRGEAVKGEDLACFRGMLDLVERELPRMVERANAWAVGDIETLRTTGYRSQYEACQAAWTSSETIRKRGLTDLDARSRAHWLQVAERALREHRTSLALVPVQALVEEDGYLAALAARGYVIESP